MLRRVWGLVGFTTNSKFVTYLSKANGVTLAANILQNIFKFIQPDLIIASAPSQGTARIYSTTFHELAHASHFRQVGSAYWIKYINYIITYGAYGNGDGKNNGVCAVGEMWGFYLGARLAHEKFGTTIYYRTSVDNWIFPVIIRRLIDEGGYSMQQIYSCLKSNVDTVPKLKDELISKIGLNKTIVNSIFKDYGF